MSRHINKYDAPALAALYTQNAIEIVAWEPAADVAVGQQAIEKKYASLFVSNPRKLSHYRRSGVIQSATMYAPSRI
jgi:hypothetical protein